MSSSLMIACAIIRDPLYNIECLKTLTYTNSWHPLAAPAAVNLLRVCANGQICRGEKAL